MIELTLIQKWLLIFGTTFIGMEFVAWFLHRFVMHGFLWSVHFDHHDPHHTGTFQKNDRFAFFFFVPSFFSILIGAIWPNPLLQSFGYGIMAYGAAYFFVHEIVIHRRLRWFKSTNFYLDGLVAAHKKHHAINTKEGAENFGMLWVPTHYFMMAYKRRTQRLETERAKREPPAPRTPRS